MRPPSLVRSRLTSYELDLSLIDIDSADHLLCTYRQFTFTESRCPSGLRRRFNCELVSFENSSDWNWIVFVTSYPPCYLVTSLFQRCHAGYRAIRRRNCDAPVSSDIGPSRQSQQCQQPQ